MSATKLKWLFYTILGLILIGAGLSMTIDAAFYRADHPEGCTWIYYGTFALVILNSGVCCFGQGVIYKMRWDQQLKDQ